MGEQIVFRHDSKALSVCNRVRIYEGEKNVDCLEFMIPTTYNNINLTDCDIRMIYINSNNVENSLLLNDFLQSDFINECMVFRVVIDEKFTAVPGELKFYLKFTQSNSEDIVLESSTAIINVDTHPHGTNTDTDVKKDIIDEILLRSKEAYNKAIQVETDFNSFKTEVLTNRLIHVKDSSLVRTKDNLYLIKHKTNSFMGMFDNSKDYDKGDIVYISTYTNVPTIEYDVMKSELNLIKKLNVSSKNAFSSSTLLVNGYMPQEGFDLNFSSQWACQLPPANFEYIGVDIGSEQVISEFDIAWVLHHHAKTVTLQTSEDGKNYINREIFTDKISYDGKGTKYILGSPIRARYIRLKFENPNLPETGYRLYEVSLLSDTSVSYYQFTKDFYGTGVEDISDYAKSYTLPEDFSFETGRIYYQLEDYKGNKISLSF